VALLFLGGSLKANKILGIILLFFAFFCWASGLVLFINPDPFYTFYEALAWFSYMWVSGLVSFVSGYLLQFSKALQGELSRREQNERKARRAFYRSMKPGKENTSPNS
jgi:hypothetical protein